MKSLLDLIKIPNWLIAILLAVFILRIPSFFEPYYYGDEMIYMTLGEGVRQGQVLYKDLHDNKPPLLYWTAAIAGNIFLFKVILAFWSLATIFVFWKLADYFFVKNKIIVIISVLIFALLTTIPLFEGNIANAELFMIGPNILAFYLLLSQKNTFRNIFTAGILFSIASLFKIPAAFEIPVIIIYWLIVNGLKDFRNVVKNSFILSLGFALPILVTFVWYFLRGAFPEYLEAAFLQNLSYVNSWKVRDVPISYRLLVILAGSAILWFNRSKLSKTFVFLSIWLLFCLFGVVLSGRPYPHYFVQALAPTSLLLAMFFAEKTTEQALVVIPLTLSFFVPFYYQFWFYPTTSYYQRFINFALGNINKQQYFNSFNEKADRNYKIAEFLQMSSLQKDKLFMWDPDSSTVYSLSRRLPPTKYVADYHINDFYSKAKVAKEIEGKLPKFVILTDNHPLPEITPLLRSKYLLLQRIQDASIFSRIDLQ